MIPETIFKGITTQFNPHLVPQILLKLVLAQLQSSYNNKSKLSGWHHSLTVRADGVGGKDTKFLLLPVSLEVSAAT
eukprot:238332-Hanusia_phi.AAC.1